MLREAEEASSFLNMVKLIPETKRVRLWYNPRDHGILENTRLYISLYPGSCHRSMKWALPLFLLPVYKPVFNFRDRKTSLMVWSAYVWWCLRNNSSGSPWIKGWCLLCILWVRKVAWPHLWGMGLPPALTPYPLHSAYLLAGTCADAFGTMPSDLPRALWFY